MLGPVAETASHLGAKAIGWEAFAAAVAGSGVPVYAIGGMTGADVQRARDAGAQGIAMQRSVWIED